MECDCNVIHEDVVCKVKQQMPKEETLFNLADLFKVFSDSTRIKILSALQHSDMCVCDLAVLIGMSKSAISHQLRILRQTRLVKYHKEGKIVIYSFCDDHVRNIFAQGLLHVEEELK